MRTIWKFPLTGNVSRIAMPSGATILFAGKDPSGEACVWAEIITNNPEIGVYVYITGTGTEVPGGAGRYINSYIDGPFVWHVYTSE